MAEKTNTDLGLGARAWETAKIYNGSNLVKHYNAIVNTDSVETLGNFTKKRGIETRGIDPEIKADDRLLKYTVTKITPEKHLDEIDNHHEIYLITDEHGHDIGTYEITENGPVFKISPKIKEYNEKIIATFSEEQQEILRKKYNTDNLEELTEKLAKGEKIALASKEQARDDIKKEYEDRGLSVSDGTTNEDSEEEKVINSIPADMRAEVLQKCKEKDLKVKEILIVTCPETLAKSIDNRKTQITKDGGPVVLIKTAYSGADSLGDDVYSFQNGGELQHTEENDDKLTSIMENHKDEGTIIDIDNNNIDNLVLDIEEAQRIIDEQLKKIEEAEYKIAELENQEFEDEYDREQALTKYQTEISDAEEVIADENKKIYDIVNSTPTKSIESQGDNTQEDDFIKNRWETADPMSGHQ